MTDQQRPLQFSPSEMARYRRQLVLDGFGPAGQEKLARAHVAILGAGGLGSPAILYLGAVGVRKITIIDDDQVDISNLHRQVIHTTAAVGTDKTESARQEVAARNPHVEVRTVNVQMTSDNALGALADADVLLDGTDNFDARYVASAACARLGIPHIWASILGFDAQLSVFDVNRGPLYEDIYRTAPPAGAVPSCAEAGVLGPLVGVVGSMMAMETVKLLTGIGTPLIGRLGYYSGLDGTWEYVPIVASPEMRAEVLDRAQGFSTAEVAGSETSGDTEKTAEPSPSAEEFPDDALLLDVREPDEYTAYAIPGAVNIPLSRLQASPDLPAEVTRQAERASEVIVYCAGGVRSATALPIISDSLVKQNIAASRIRDLPGGINGWLDGQV